MGGQLNVLFQEFSSVRQSVANKNYDVAVCKARGIARLLHDDASINSGVFPCVKQSFAREVEANENELL